MELRHLRYFVAIAEEAGLNRAAARLRVAQPALSRQLQNLEKEMGGPLCHRSAAGVTLTPAGEILLERARVILRSVQDATRAVRERAGSTPKRLTVGYIVNFHLDYLRKALARLRQAHPDLELNLFQGPQAALLSALRSGEIDLAFVNLPTRLDGLESEVIRRAPLVVVLPPGHALLRKKTLQPSDLAGERFVFCTRESRPEFYDFVHAHFLARNVPLRAEREIHGPLDGVVGLVQLGAGLSVLPHYPGVEKIYPVDWRPFRAPIPMLEFALAWRANDPSPWIEDFRREAREKRVSPAVGAA